MTDPDYRVRLETGNAVHRIVTAAGGQFTERPLLRSDPDGGKVREPEPLAGIAAAGEVEQAARRLVLEYTRYAREDGLTWHTIGEAMGFADNPQPGMTSVAEHAFQRAVPGRAAADWFPWTCPSCRNLVRDYGPEHGPREAEQGHADGCERFASAVRSWEAQWDEWDEEGGTDDGR
jgi:hypothetical protein